MDNAIRLYFDESVEIKAAYQLAQRGLDVVTVRDLGLLGDSDENHLQRATQMGRVLCTYDSDFLRLAAEGMKHVGIVYAREHMTGIGDWVRSLEHLHNTRNADDMRNHIEYL
ncbi:MAG: DUF5615 family PIN-like protein [Anaerolineales bacterium]